MKYRIGVFTYNFEWRVLALHIVFYAVLMWVFTTYTVDIYLYMNLWENSFNIEKAIFSPFLIVAAFALLRKNDLPSYFLLNIILVLVVTPSLVLFSGCNLPLYFVLTTWFAFAVVAVITQTIKVRTIAVKPISMLLLLRCIAVCSIIFVVSIIAFDGLKFINFDFSRVYDFRQDAADNLPFMYAYLMPNFSYVIIPIGIVLSLLFKKRVLLLVLIFCAVMIFALTSHKSPLFIPFFIICAYWFYRHPQKVSITIMVLITGVVISGLLYYLIPRGLDDIWIWIGAIIVFRIFALPAILNWHHLEFFSTHPYYYWADSKFSFGLVTSPYDLPMPFQVSAFKVGVEGMGSANTGWIGSGMGQAGYLGILFYSVLFGLLLSVIDAYGKKLDRSFIFAVFLVTVTSAAETSDLSIMPLTHGMITLFVILVLLNADEIKKRILM